MPTSASKSRNFKHAGFTLLELLVVLAIIGVMTSLVAISVSAPSTRTLKSEGEKLAARLNAAQAQLAAGATPLRLIATPEGYAFEQMARATDGAANTQWERLADDDVLKPRSLPVDAKLNLDKPMGLSREPVANAANLRLTQGDIAVTLATAGVGGWAVQGAETKQ